MRQYELAIRIAQVHHLVDERKYKKALAVIQTLDMRQVRSLSDLRVFAEVYTKTEQYEAAKATYLRIYRRSRTRRVLYRLIYLSIRTNALEDAEAYYQEFVRMNPNARDALILRYRIDKAAGVPIGQLIEILQELKQEEYIEEWAYELAKLYHRAGRREECLEECEDIILWFGTGEIVERAKILIDHLQEKDPIPYYDDKDFTMPGKEEPNPDDTGSLPDLNEFIKERKAQRKEERRAEKEMRREEVAEEEYEEEDEYDEEEDDIASLIKNELTEKEEELPKTAKREEKKPVSEELHKPVKEKKVSDDTFIDDYEEDDFEQDGIDFSQKAKDGIQKLSGFLKLGKKEEEKPEEVKAEKMKPEKPIAEEAEREMRTKAENIVPERKEEMTKKSRPKYVPHSQSGTGITQDLAKEISAIYEMEHREQLKEKAVTVINEVPNIATSVVDRMTQAIQKSAGKGYIPIDIEEIHGRKEEERASEVQEETLIIRGQAEEREEPKDDLMKALDAEVEEYYEKMKESTAVEDDRHMDERTGAEIAPAEESSFVEMANKDSNIGLGASETATGSEEKTETELLRDLLEEEIQDPEEIQEKKEEVVEEVIEEVVPEELTEEVREDAIAEEAVEEIREEVAPKEAAEEVIEEVVPEEAEEEVIEEVAPEEAEEVIEEVVPEELTEEVREEAIAEEPVEEIREEVIAEKSAEEVREEPAPDESMEEEETSDEQPERSGSPLENYQAPEIPVVETDYMELPEISYEDLPTTRALHQSFQNVLKLIAGELDPSHFVLMGDGTERIVGVAKQIVRVMKETGYLSQGRIAKIHAEQLNTMDLITFRSQLKGNCLLIEEAADLLFPTITKIFSIMEEYYGDFVVILADEGTTLDQLFRFVPVLAKKFKYIIDISRYTEKDYK